jgi:hypothetical protein
MPCEFGEELIGLKSKFLESDESDVVPVWRLVLSGSARCGSLTTALRRQIKGRKHPGRHAGSPVERCRSFRDIQDRDGAFHLLRRAPRLFPFIERIFADGGYADADGVDGVAPCLPGACRSSSDRTLVDLRCCARGGSSNKRSRGLVVTVALLATGERYATTVAFIRLA